MGKPVEYDISIWCLLGHIIPVYVFLAQGNSAEQSDSLAGVRRVWYQVFLNREDRFTNLSTFVGACTVRVSLRISQRKVERT